MTQFPGSAGFQPALADATQTQRLSQPNPGSTGFQPALSEPVVEQWMIDQVGPQARLNQAAEGMNTLGRAIAAFPEVLKNAEQIAAQLSQGGVKLHPDSTRAIADAQTRQTAHARVAIWIGALALAALAIAQF